MAGYDRDTGRVLVADRDRELHPVGWDTLEKARGSQYKPFPPRHAWFTFDFAAAHPPAPADIRESIAEVCRGMLAPPIANLGVKGIRKAIRETMKWPEVLDADALRRACFNVAIFIDRRGGTGGGIFRYMYGRFLGEAASITGEPRLAGMGTELTAIGDRWEEVAAAFRRCGTGPKPGGPAQEGHHADARHRRPRAGLLGTPWRHGETVMITGALKLHLRPRRNLDSSAMVAVTPHA